MVSFYATYVCGQERREQVTKEVIRHCSRSLQLGHAAVKVRFAAHLHQNNYRQMILRRSSQYPFLERRWDSRGGWDQETHSTANESTIQYNTNMFQIRKCFCFSGHYRFYDVLNDKGSAHQLLGEMIFKKVNNCLMTSNQSFLRHGHFTVDVKFCGGIFEVSKEYLCHENKNYLFYSLCRCSLVAAAFFWQDLRFEIGSDRSQLGWGMFHRCAQQQEAESRQQMKIPRYCPYPDPVGKGSGDEVNQIKL